MKSHIMSNFIYNDSEIQMNSKLVLCIEEHDSIKDIKSIDTRLFIYWSNHNNNFCVRGKRQNIETKDFVPYAFHCKSVYKLYDFIKFVVGAHSNTSIILYNFNNFDKDVKDDDLTYEFFEENIDRNYEIAAYDLVKLKRKNITKYLKMIKNMYNWDNNYK